MMSPADPGLTPDDYKRIHLALIASNDRQDIAIRDKIVRYLAARQAWVDDAIRRKLDTER